MKRTRHFRGAPNPGKIFIAFDDSTCAAGAKNSVDTRKGHYSRKIVAKVVCIAPNSILKIFLYERIIQSDTLTHSVCVCVCVCVSSVSLHVYMCESIL